MFTKNQELEYPNNNIFGVLAGLLIGCVAGAMTMLLLAPQSGKRTRMQIQKKGIELRERTTEIVEDAMKQVQQDSKKITRDGRKKAKELMKQGQELVVEQIEHVTDAVKAGQKAILSS
jgi:gas vesicle protein